jgi:hypothetical protein
MRPTIPFFSAQNRLEPTPQPGRLSGTVQLVSGRSPEPDEVLVETLVYISILLALGPSR